MISRALPKLVPVFALALISACDVASREPGPRVLVTDSAGVVIVESRGEPGRTWEIAAGDAPVVRLGSEDDGAPDFFGRINSAHLDSRGNVWVVDLMSAELKAFDVPTGTHLFTAGRRGDGPGEFRMPFPVGFDEERAWIWDQTLGRLTVLSLDGELLETRRIGTDREITPRLLFRTERGSFLAQLPQAFAGTVTDGMTIQDTVRIWELQADGWEPELVAERKGVTWYFAEGTQAPVPFALGTRFGVGAGRVVLSDPDGGPALDVVQDGTLVRRIRIDRERTPVTREATERELASPVRSEAAQALLREHLGRVSLPDLLPTWEWVRVGRGGHVFALRYGTLLSGEVWDVFDPEGRWVGSVVLPEETHLMDADDRHMVLVEMPEMRGPAVAVYRFPEGWADSWAATTEASLRTGSQVRAGFALPRLVAVWDCPGLPRRMHRFPVSTGDDRPTEMKWRLSQ